MTEIDPYTWPGRLHEWLHEYEGYGLRSERLLADIERADSKTILEWIKAAYTEGYNQSRYDTMKLYWDDGK